MSASKVLSTLAGDTSDREFVVTRLLDAPRELVWDAMTDPAKVAKWWGPRGFTTTIHEMDFRPGGHWKHTMHGPDGDFVIREFGALEGGKQTLERLAEFLAS